MSKKRLSLSITFALLGLTVITLLQFQNIFDAWRLHGYQPSAKVVTLADDTTMNTSMRRLFYVYHPELDDKTVFSQHCSNSDTEQTIVLGCYIDGHGIYLFDVTDPRLDGVVEVTAAHETLHAVYARLSRTDKKNVDDMINAAYAKVTDQRIRSTIDQYQKDGADVTNELHSILGTEVRNLPPDLEAYYKRYFTDREKIVSYSEKYEQVFVGYKNQAANLKSQIDSLDNEIHSLEGSLKTRFDQLGAQKTTMDALKTNGQFEAYNAQVSSYNAAVNSYNSDRSTYEQKISYRNSLAEQYNQIAVEEQSLIKSIDSRAASQPQ